MKSIQSQAKFGKYICHNGLQPVNHKLKHSAHRYGINIQIAKIKPFRITLFILISCNLTFAQNPSAKTNHDKVDLLVQKYYKSFEAAGLAVGIVKQGNDIYSNTFGYQNIDTKTPLTEYSMFHMASISKPVTATIIAKLYEDSLIDIDKPYIDYVPFFKMADTLYNKVTTRQLVTH